MPANTIYERVTVKKDENNVLVMALHNIVLSFILSVLFALKDCYFSSCYGYVLQCIIQTTLRFYKKKQGVDLNVGQLNFASYIILVFLALILLIHHHFTQHEFTCRWSVGRNVVIVPKIKNCAVL